MVKEEWKRGPNGLWEQVEGFFRRNPDETLTPPDVAVKFGMDIKRARHVLMTLHRDGKLQKTECGRMFEYSLK
jgi:hypothetical protein